MSLVAAGGFLAAAIFPDVFLLLGRPLQIGKRWLIVVLLSNTFLLTVVFYLAMVSKRHELTLNTLIRETAKEGRQESDGEPSVFLVMPAYNEVQNIGPVLDSLPEKVLGHEVCPIVVSDSSTDGTVSIARETDAIVVDHPINSGQGTALNTGFDIALAEGADIVVTMDADGQHPPDEIGTILKPVLADEAEMVIGSRYKGNDQSGNGVVRKSGIRAFTVLINVLVKQNLTDCTSGFRAIRSDVLRKLTLTEHQFIAPELIMEVLKNGYRVREVPVTIHERDHGSSKKPQLGYAFGLTRTILAAWLR
jgi:glycosyltransferase involved in cell wall biosynthesis